MLRYLKGDKYIHGVDFLQYGYDGGIRSLEVTVNKYKMTFHPHFHCMILFRKDVDLQGQHLNSFSYDKLHPDAQPYKFSDFEILLQKVWCLLMNDQKVTLDSINNLKRGYSIKVLDSKGYYHECFKYVCDSAFEDGSILDYEVFKVLQRALYNRRVIQGYGKLHNFNDFDNKEVEVLTDFRYTDLIRDLHKIERPVKYSEQLNEVIDRSKHCKYISRSLIKQVIMRERKEEINQEVVEDF